MGVKKTNCYLKVMRKFGVEEEVDDVFVDCLYLIFAERLVLRGTINVVVLR